MFALNLRNTRRNWLIAFTLAFMIAAFGGSTFAQTTPATISVDTDQFINAINQWLPMAITIAAIGVGIAGGFKLAQFVGRMIVDAFDGRL